jgi:hypothetical protein
MVQDVSQVIEVRAAAQLLNQIKGTTGSSLGLLNGLVNQSLLSGSFEKYRDALFELGAIPKLLDDRSLAMALQAAVMLTEIKRTMGSDKGTISINTPLTLDSIKTPAGSFTAVLLTDLSATITALESLIFLREKSL